MTDTRRENLLSWWARFVCRHAWPVLIVSGVLAVAAIAFAATQLRFQAERNDLIAPDLEWNQRFIRYRAVDPHDAIGIVVEVPQKPGGRERAERFVDELSARLRDDPNIESVSWGFDPRDASAAMIRLLPMERFRDELSRVRASRPLLQADSLTGLIEAITQQLGHAERTRSGDLADAQLEMLESLLAGVELGVDGELDGDAIARLQRRGGETWRYLTSEDGRLLFIDIAPRIAHDKLDQYAPAVTASRAHLDAVRAAMPDVDAGITGVPVMEADETEIAMSDSTRCSIVAVCAIALLLMYAFGGWRLPVLAVAALMVAVAWSYGFVTLAIGHLQVLSVVFTVILLGLGIDFGIHLLSRFEQVRHDFADGADGMCEAIADALLKTGPGIITGAVTTGIAFGTTLMTEFTGMAEMGLIAGVGVMLCLVSMLAVLPALMRVCHMHTSYIKPVTRRAVDLYRFRWLMPFVRHPVATASAAAVFAIACAATIPQVRYDNDLTELLPKDMESVVWQDRVQSHSDTALWYGAMIADDLDEARRLTEAARRLPTVASVGGAGLLFPADDAPKRGLLAETRTALGDALDPRARDTPPSRADTLQTQLRAMAVAFGAAMQREDVRTNPDTLDTLARLRDRTTRIAAVMGDAAFGADAEARMATMHRAMRTWQEETRRRLGAVLGAESLKPGDLPPPLRAQLGRGVADGRLLVKAYPRDNIWDPAKLEPFIVELRTVDPNVTGTTVQIYESGMLIQRSYIKAGWMALIAVFVLVLIDFRSLIDAALCLLPVTLGFVTMFAALWLFDVPINPANIIVLPLLFGIGVDSGVHILHRYRQDRFDHPPGLAAGTGKGVILTSLTTLIGFSLMMTAEHRGIQTLGFVLTVGIAATLVACLIVMPAVLELRNRWQAWRRLRGSRSAVTSHG